MKRTILVSIVALSLSAPAGAAVTAPAVRMMRPPVATAPLTHISKQQAMTIAIQAAGGGTALGAHHDDFHDRRTWQVQVLNGKFRFQVDVDAITGQVLRIRKQRES
jgi:uncharacterized membrane protein YkoI